MSNTENLELILDGIRVELAKIANILESERKERDKILQKFDNPSYQKSMGINIK